MVLIYNYLPIKDLGLTIIILTIIIRLLLLPLSYKAARTQREITKIQPRLKEIQKQYKDNREEQAKLLMALYKEHKINPLSGIIPILIQLPILFALYRSFMMLIKGTAAIGSSLGALVATTTTSTIAVISTTTPAIASLLYSFVVDPGTINPTFLGLVDLSQRNIPLAIITGLLQFALSKMIAGGAQKTKSGDKKSPSIGNMMGTQMTYILPAMTVLFALQLPAGLPLYWATTTLFSLGEQFWIKRKHPDQLIKNDQEIKAL
ncbi:MAG: YidC/Oxa1 family membrane protein insertase [Candidatus Paceibacterota bacterium]|jgi:YidC/Oxa1 family membrane protein insertase